MPIVTIILIFMFLLNLAMIYLLFTSNPSGTINRFLGSFLIPITLTNLEMLLFINAWDGPSPRIGLSLAVFGALSFFPLFFHFSLYFPRKRLTARNRRLCLTLYICALCLGILLLTTLWRLKDGQSAPSVFMWGLSGEAPAALVVLFLCILCFLIVTQVMTVAGFVSSLSLSLTERERRTAVMIPAGFLPLSFGLVFILLFFKPIPSGFLMYCIISVLHTVFFSILSFRFGFLDRKILFRVFIFFPINIGVIAFSYFYALKPLNLWLSSLFPVNEAFFLGIELVVVSIFCTTLYRVASRAIDSRFFSSLNNLHDAMLRTQEALNEVIDLDHFCQVLLKFFSDTLGVRTVCFFFLSEDRFVLYHPFEHSGEASFSSGGELATALRSRGRILLVQQIALGFTDKTELEVLEKLKGVLVVPLGRGDRLEGFLLLGSDKSGAWDQSEIDSLEIFSAGFVSVFERCRSHSRAIELEKKQARIEKTAVISELLGGIAHEIRNPLSIITASAETLQDADLSKPEQRTCAGYIKEESERLSGILGKILSSFSLAFEFEHGPVDVVPVVSGVLEFLRMKLDVKQISVSFSGPKSLSAVIDREALTQVCLNLFLNAQEFLDEGGSLSVVFTDASEEGRVFIDIHDNGQPIVQAIRKRIFDPFFTTRANGTGLGLPISLRILRNAHGDLVLLPSEEGNTFRIMLPKEK